MPSSDNIFIFNGDLVDRGDHSCEIVLLIFANSAPSSDLVDRGVPTPSLSTFGGNHEEPHINIYGGFEEECVAKYDHGVFQAYHAAFLWLPYACVVNGRALVLHAGLPADETVGVSDAQSRPRTGRVQRGGELGQGGLDSRHAVERSAPGPRVSRDGAERARCGGALGRGRDDCFFGAGESLGHCSLASVRAQRRRYPARQARLHGVQRE